MGFEDWLRGLGYFQIGNEDDGYRWAYPTGEDGYRIIRAGEDGNPLDDLYAQYSAAMAPPPTPEPVYTPPPAPEPVYYAPPPAPEPVYTPPPAPEPVYYAPPPAPEPVYYAPPPEPVEREHGVRSRNEDSEPVYYTPPPAPEPVYTAPTPAPEPVYTPPPAPEPVYTPPSPSEPVYTPPPPEPEPTDREHGVRSYREPDESPYTGLDSSGRPIFGTGGQRFDFIGSGEDREYAPQGPIVDANGLRWKQIGYEWGPDQQRAADIGRYDPTYGWIAPEDALNYVVQQWTPKKDFIARWADNGGLFNLLAGSFLAPTAFADLAAAATTGGTSALTADLMAAGNVPMDAARIAAVDLGNAGLLNQLGVTNPIAQSAITGGVTRGLTGGNPIEGAISSAVPGTLGELGVTNPYVSSFVRGAIAPAIRGGSGEEMLAGGIGSLVNRGVSDVGSAAGTWLDRTFGSANGSGTDWSNMSGGWSDTGGINWNDGLDDNNYYSSSGAETFDNLDRMAGDMHMGSSGGNSMGDDIDWGWLDQTAGDMEMGTSAPGQPNSVSPYNIDWDQLDRMAGDMEMGTSAPGQPNSVNPPSLYRTITGGLKSLFGPAAAGKNAIDQFFKDSGINSKLGYGIGGAGLLYLLNQLNRNKNPVTTAPTSTFVPQKYAFSQTPTYAGAGKPYFTQQFTRLAKGGLASFDLYNQQEPGVAEIEAQVKKLSPSLLELASTDASDPIVQGLAKRQLLMRNATQMPSKTSYYNMARGGMASLPEYAAGGKLLRGPGDGMSDSIPAVIKGKNAQRAALADGEFVVPADVVSHLGNGSTEAGAKRLYAMMDRIRSARTGRKKQAPAVKADRYMPA